MPFSNWYSPKIFRRQVRFHDNVVGADTSEIEVLGSLDVVGAFALGGDQITSLGSELNSLVRFEGTLGYQTLELAAAVVEGDTFSFEHDGVTQTYEVKVLDQAVQDTANNAGGALTADASDRELEMTDGTHGLVAGELILIGTEVMQVVEVDGASLVVDRARCGSTLAIHAQNQAVTNGLALAAADNVPVGFAAGALTNAVSSIRIPATVNNNTIFPITGYRLANQHVLFQANDPGEYDITLAETFTEATNIWMGDWVNGTDGGVKRLTQISHVVTGAEEAADQIVIPTGFAPNTVIAQLRSATGEVKTFDGDVTTEAAPHRVVIENPAAGVDFADTDILTLFIYE